MASTASSYQKLPGRGLRYTTGVSATRCRLWLGDDHLLAVESTLIYEEYRRFYFRDIEAIIIRRTARRQIINWALVVIALITASPFLIAWNSERTGGPAVMAVLCLLFWGIFIVANTLRGPTCQTRIRTAAQIEELPSLNRVKLAQRVLARVEPLIAATQGEWKGGEMTNDE